MDLGELKEAEKALTQQEFDILIAHKDGLHEGDEKYECPICRFDIEKWREVQMTRYEVVPATPVQDSVPIGWKESGR